MYYQNQSIVTLVGLLFLIVLFPSYNLKADPLIISGKVLDAENDEPLAYATIAIADYKIGTVSNLQGEFDIHISDDLQGEELVVSMLGYIDFKIKVSDVPANSDLIVRLEPGRLLLDEVTIAETLSGGELLKIALARIEMNYPMSPTAMDAFYRETKMVDGEYVDLLEAAIKIYDKDYSVPRDRNKLRERVALIEVRKTLEFEYELEKYFSKYNVLEDLLLENQVKYRSFSEDQAFYDIMHREQVVGYNGRPIELVSITQTGYNLKIYIDDDYGIRKISFKWGDGKTPLYTYRKSGKLENQVIHIEKEVEFQKINGKLYLKYISANYTNRWHNLKTGEIDVVTKRDQALLVNAINYTNPRWVGTSEKMKRYGLQFQHDEYNKAFWDNYNVIKQMPLQQNVVMDLEESYSLEEQFEFFK